jgi:hypothetical protein
MPSAEADRLVEVPKGRAPWKRSGPYLSERAWGTVREDYSADGTAWDFFPHEHSRSRVYRWNEDGLAGICDDRQTLCFALAFWNGRDPILKERIFGLTGTQGNHSEDAKEYYRLVGIFLDSDGHRPVFGSVAKFQDDHAWHDLIPFYEYFNGDSGAGIGAWHQTGWTPPCRRPDHPASQRGLRET